MGQATAEFEAPYKGNALGLATVFKGGAGARGQECFVPGGDEGFDVDQCGCGGAGEGAAVNKMQDVDAQTPL